MLSQQYVRKVVLNIILLKAIMVEVQRAPTNLQHTITVTDFLV